jgi:L-alanine-DL-glutamate epimerase-like enolase superfamily enzyme
MDEGYRIMKVKVGGAPLAEDLKRLDAAIQVLGSAQNLAVDANGAWQRPAALEYAKALQAYHFKMVRRANRSLRFLIIK